MLDVIGTYEVQNDKIHRAWFKQGIPVLRVTIGG